MQDRFKFRTWHKPTNTMEYNGLWTGRDWDKKMSDCNFIIMQCTGLKDKNGKLIFEGDIVEVINCRGANAIVEYDTERAKFKLNGKKFSPSALEHIRNDYFEVIGNVYENQELLEDK